ncbi:MAG TPA: hypothetical protein VHD56_13370 [Tepidisphaeraceae bacterium]|nr:hypothetical protein [Tepidisphaeraceae bacterium]
MRGSKWTLPLVVVAMVLMGISIKSVVAQDAKGGIKGDVKTADGQPAAGIPLSLFKGTVEFPAFGRGGRRGGGAGGDGGATPPATQPALPTPVATATTDDKGAYKFEGVEPGDYTLMAGGFGGGRRGGGAGGPGGGGAAPGGGQGGQGGQRGRGMGRGTATVTVKAGETATKDIQLQAGRGGRRGGGGGGAAPGQGA